MATIKTLHTRLQNSPRMRRGGADYFPCYRAWKAVMMRRADGAAHFAAVQAFSADVAGGYYHAGNNFPSIRRRQRAK